MHPLVDAFLQGRGKFKKIQGHYFDNLKKPRLACHTGAIYYAVYGKTAQGVAEPLSKDFPEVREPLVTIPCEHKDLDQSDPNGTKGSIIGILIHLNDEHDGHTWPDKKVAEWLDMALKSQA